MRYIPCDPMGFHGMPHRVSLGKTEECGTLGPVGYLTLSAGIPWDIQEGFRWKRQRTRNTRALGMSVRIPSDSIRCPIPRENQGMSKTRSHGIQQQYLLVITFFRSPSFRFISFFPHFRECQCNVDVDISRTLPVPAIEYTAIMCRRGSSSVPSS